MDQSIQHLRLRPHHVLCIPFLDAELMSDRGEKFLHEYLELMEILISDEDTMIEVTRGVDDLCQHCLHLGEGRCVSRIGDEEKVRRWDAKVMEGLGLNYGDKKTSMEIKGFIKHKAPLDFCRTRCPWKSICMVWEK
jgi:hypothetical protein